MRKPKEQHDDEGNEASDSDDETVTVENVNPVVSIVKSATPSSLPEPGGSPMIGLQPSSGCNRYHKFA